MADNTPIAANRRNGLRRIVPLIVVLALVVAGGYKLYAQQAAANSGVLQGSGSIEATEVSVATDTAGRIKAVLAGEGDSVKAGQELVQFDDAILQAQRRQAEASLSAAQANVAAAEASQAAAQANLDQVKAGARSQELEAELHAVVAAQGRVTTAEGQLAQTRGGLQASQAARDQAAAAFANLKQGARPEQIEAVSVAYQQAQAAVNVAQSNYDKIASRPDAGALPQSLALQQATFALQAAKSNYEGMLSGATTPQLDQARAAINQAQAGILQASATISQTESALVTAKAGLSAEQARLDMMRAGARPEQVRAAEAQVAAAQAQAKAAAGQVAAALANINLLDTQIGRLTIKAPADGVVFSRAVEPGEVALPGGTLAVLADLGHLSVTVYLPEDRYGEVKLGDAARVSVDSFPGQVFQGTVQHIADRAEFTPRNVQTPTGRRTTVFAVKLSVDNPESKLKPGMPADVVFAK
jgi:HlyD family secretion protein